MNSFYANDDHLKKYAKILYHDKIRYMDLIRTLRKVGKFGMKIELKEENNSDYLFDKMLYVVDRYDEKFSFYLKSYDYERRDYLKQSYGNHYIIYDITWKDTKKCIEKEGFVSKRGYTLEMKPSFCGSPKTYIFKKDNICYYAALPANVSLNLYGLFTSLSNFDNIGFFDFYSIVSGMIDEKRAKFLKFWACKDKKEIGRISFADGELSDFHLWKDSGSERAELTLENQVLTENIYSMKKISYEEMSEESLKEDVEKGRQLVFNYTKKDQSV